MWIPHRLDEVFKFQKNHYCRTDWVISLLIMNQLVRNIILILLVLSAFMLPTLVDAGMIDLPEEDDFNDKDAERDDFAVISEFPIAWIRIPVHQMSVLFRLGISIFALFGVYVGGRSKRKLFNDRTIDPADVLIANLKTTLFRVVFIF
jgi:hypothetical protein